MRSRLLYMMYEPSEQLFISPRLEVFCYFIIRSWLKLRSALKLSRISLGRVKLDWSPFYAFPKLLFLFVNFPFSICATTILVTLCFTNCWLPLQRFLFFLAIQPFPTGRSVYRGAIPHLSVVLSVGRPKDRQRLPSTTPEKNICQRHLPSYRIHDYAQEKYYEVPGSQ